MIIGISAVVIISLGDGEIIQDILIQRTFVEINSAVLGLLLLG